MDKTTFLAFISGMLLLSILFMPVGTKFIPHLIGLGVILGAWWFTRI